VSSWLKEKYTYGCPWLILELVVVLYPSLVIIVIEPDATVVIVELVVVDIDIIVDCCCQKISLLSPAFHPLSP
jgi:hypothetical protein